jgi:hypothetical protein
MRSFGIYKKKKCMRDEREKIKMYWGIKTNLFTIVVSISANGNFLPL